MNKLIRQIFTGTIVLAGMGTIVVGASTKVDAFSLEYNFNNPSTVLTSNASAPPLPKPDAPNNPGYDDNWKFGWQRFFVDDPNDSFMMSSIEAAAYLEPDVTINTWLLLNEIVPLVNGAEISFDTKQFFSDELKRANRLEVRYNITGSCRIQDKEPPGCEARDGDGLLTIEDTKTVGDFTYQFLKDDGSPLVVNPDLIVDGYPTEWTTFTGRINGLTQPAFGRIGFRYFVPEASLSKQPNGSYIGIDNIRYQTPIPTPALLPGLLAIGWKTWRKRKQQAIG